MKLNSYDELIFIKTSTASKSTVSCTPFGLSVSSKSHVVILSHDLAVNHMQEVLASLFPRTFISRLYIIRGARTLQGHGLYRGTDSTVTSHSIPKESKALISFLNKLGIETKLQSFNGRLRKRWRTRGDMTFM